MKVAIIGAGNVGKALGTSIARAGHDVTISARSAGSAREAAAAIGARAAGSNTEALEGADVVVLAVPYVGAGETVVREIAESVRGRTVIDVTNPLKPDFSGLATDSTSAAEEFQKLLPGAHVVKAFNTIFASNQANPRGDIDAFVAGDDAGAKRDAIELAESIGFRALDIGPLSSARYLEGMGYVNIAVNAQNGWSWTSAWKLER